MIDYQNVLNEVRDYCHMADFDTYDHEGILTDIRNFSYEQDMTVTSIDDLPYHVFQQILEDNDTGMLTQIA